MMQREDDQELEEGGEPSAVSAMETKLLLARRMVARLKEQLENVERLLSSEAEAGDLESLVTRKRTEDGEIVSSNIDRVIDGVFDGEHMIGEDGRKYLVPPNYSSKSKLVEGDMLRLTIADNGKFVFKQKGPIDRQRLVGSLTQDELSNDWQVMTDGQRYRVLTAAVTYHKGESGDEAVILVPKNAPSKWAALENIIKKEE